MKVLKLILLSLCLLATPVVAVEYQGQNLDGRKLAAKAYYQRTGGVYQVQVQFERDLATLYFSDGGQTTIKLRGQVISDPGNIVGFGRLGHIYLGNWFNVGLEYNDSTGESGAAGFTVGEDIWRLSLDPDEL